MADLKSRVAYLQGLATGLEMPGDSKEARLLSGIVEVMGAFADSVDELEASQDGLEDYLESVDEDLYVLERRIGVGDADDECDHFIQVECPECEEDAKPELANVSPVHMLAGDDGQPEGPEQNNQI